MIDKNTTLSLDWLSKVAKQYPKSDISLIEKTVRALVLLEGLKMSGLNFVFKGGTALMLMQQENPKRLSIDIDIIVPRIPNNLNEVLATIVVPQGFSHFEGQNRITSSSIEKGHYKFFFTPIYQTNRKEDYIMLDILFEDIPYQNIIETPLKSPFIDTNDKPLMINTPSFEGILGDKMTAFAPNTTGIPYTKGNDNKSMEIIKQLFDIGNIFDEVSEMAIIRDTFNRLAIIEAKYRNLDINPHDVLEDMYQTVLCMAVRGQDGNCQFENLLSGINQLKQYIISENFTFEKTILITGKIAYLTRLIDKNINKIVKFDSQIDLKNLLITLPHNTKLNKLKKTSPDAFWYWWCATQNV
jgi:predicted nucleotidyltransferase component of viral defense system